MTTMNKTLTIKTGKRTWSLVVTKATKSGWELVSDSGLTYTLTKSGMLEAERETRKDGRRLYTWSVTNAKAVLKGLTKKSKYQAKADALDARIRASVRKAA